MKESARYVNIIEWSGEDRCYVGSCPSPLHGRCHGENELEVFARLCALVDKVIDLYHRNAKPLPPPTITSAS